jgi:pseudouridine synthase
MSNLIRLNKHLAHTLGMSRRAADICIDQGRVLINGKVATLGNVVDSSRDVIEIDNSQVTQDKKRYTYVLLNKPVGYICSRRQQGDTPTIYSLLPRSYQDLKVAGRLDKDSCGLVLLTDDGDTIFKLTHPKFGKKKVYIVSLNKTLAPEHKKQIEEGLLLDDGTSQFTVEKVTSDPSSKKRPNTYKVTMHEGRNRQIRRTFGELRYMVTHLQRVKMGPYEINDIPSGKHLQL